MYAHSPCIVCCEMAWPIMWCQYAQLCNWQVPAASVSLFRGNESVWWYLLWCQCHSRPGMYVCAAHRLCTLGTCVAKLFQQSICRTILNVFLHSHIFPPSPLLAGSSPSQDLLAGQPRHHGTLCERGHPAQVKNWQLPVNCTHHVSYPWHILKTYILVHLATDPHAVPITVAGCISIHTIHLASFSDLLSFPLLAVCM